MMCNRFRAFPNFALTLAATVFVGAAVNAGEYDKALSLADLANAKPATVFQNVRASKVYVNPPELVRFGFSNAVVVNSWTQPLRLAPIAGAAKRSADIGVHARSALERLEQKLEAMGSNKNSVLTTDIYYESGGDNFDKLIAISDELNKFFAERMAYQVTPPQMNDLPVRDIYGVKDVAAHLGLSQPTQVALSVTVLDPETTTEKRLARLDTVPTREDGRANFLIGGLLAQNMALTTPTEDQPARAFRQLDKVLDAMGATRGDIELLTVNYVTDTGLSQSVIDREVAEYFQAGPIPEIRMVEVEVAGFFANDACLAAEGTLQIN